MLEKFPLLANLGTQQIKEIEAVCDRKTYKPEEFLFHEGEYSDEIYFLTVGTVDLCKIEEKTQNEIKFKEMVEGQSLGEMSFADGSPRSCSVKAASAVEAYILSKQTMMEKLPNATTVLNTLLLNINNEVNNYLRYLSDRHIGTLQKQIDELKERTNFAYFLFFLLLCLFLVTMGNAVMDDFFPNVDVYSSIFNWIYLFVVILLPLFLGFKKLDLSIKELVLTTKKLKKSIVEGIILSCLGVLLVFGIVATIDALNPKQDLVNSFLTWTLSGPRMLVYLISSYVQQFVRAVVQISVQRFLLDKRGFYSVAISSLIFGMCHAQYGTQAIAITLVASTIFGLIYLRTYNLVGVTLFHFILGAVVINMTLL